MVPAKENQKHVIYCQGTDGNAVQASNLSSVNNITTPMLLTSTLRKQYVFILQLRLNNMHFRLHSKFNSSD